MVFPYNLASVSILFLPTQPTRHVCMYHNSNCGLELMLFLLQHPRLSGLPQWLSGKEPNCQCRRQGFHLWVGKIPSRRKWQPTPVFLSGKSHGQRSLAGCRHSHKESDRSEPLTSSSDTISGGVITQTRYGQILSPVCSLQLKYTLIMKVREVLNAMCMPVLIHEIQYKELFILYVTYNIIVVND